MALRLILGAVLVAVVQVVAVRPAAADSPTVTPATGAAGCH
jgi:hypothetical protein